MTSPNTVAYCYMGPGVLADHIDEIQQSGLTTVVLWALHVGRPDAGQQYGDLVYDYTGMTLVSAGAFNPFQKDDIAAWPSQVAALKQSGSVSKIFMSIGGANPPIDDFTTIQKMLNNGQADVLQENFRALRTAFTVNGSCVIDGFDMDCEESIDESTMVQFCQMLFDLGFEVTFCPYWNQQFWQDCMQTLWNQGLKVSWWNLQCYSGGIRQRRAVLDRKHRGRRGSASGAVLYGAGAVGRGSAERAVPDRPEQHLHHLRGLEQPRSVRRFCLDLRCPSGQSRRLQRHGNAGQLCRGHQ